MSSFADIRSGQTHNRGTSQQVGFSATSNPRPQTALNCELSGRGQLGRVTSQTRLNAALANIPKAREAENSLAVPSPARQSEMISGLRNQLLNIRSEVSKLLVEKPAKTGAEDRLTLGKRTSAFQDQSNIAPDGRASEAVRPKADSSLRCLQVQNETLKLQLTGLKRRYAQKKQAHEQEVAVLNKKIKTLEMTLQLNQENIVAYKREIEKEMESIKDRLAGSKIEAKKAEMEREVEKHRYQAMLQEEKVKELEIELIETRKVYTDRLNECESQVGQVHQIIMEKNQLVGRLREQLAQTVSQIKIEAPLAEGSAQTEELADPEKQSQKRYILILRQEIEELSEKISQMRAYADRPKGSASTQTQMEEPADTVNQSFTIVAQPTAVAVGCSAAEYQSLQQLYKEKVEQLRRQQIEESQRYSQFQAQADALREQIIQLQQSVAAARKQAERVSGQLAQERSTHLKELAIVALKEQLKVATPSEGLINVEGYMQEIQELHLHNHSLLAEIQNKDRCLEQAKHEIRQLSITYCQISEDIGVKERQFNDLQNELNEKLSIEQNRNDSLQNKLKAAELDQRAALDELKEEIRQLTLKRPTYEAKTFDEALKVKIQEIDELKTLVNKKSEEIYQLKDKIACNRSQVENIKAELEIEKLKAIAQRKNMQVTFEVELQRLKNEIEVEKKTAESLAGKVRAVTEETRSKDEFIQKYIMGRRSTGDEKAQVEEFFRQYQLSFPVNKLKDRLVCEQLEIRRLEQLNERLVVEISGMRVRAQEKYNASELTRISSDPNLSETEPY